MNRRTFAQVAATALTLAPGRSEAASTSGMRLGLITQLRKDPDAAIRKVHDFGIPTCQVSVSSFGPEVVSGLLTALKRYQIEATSVVAGGPGPEIYDFYRGPETIGLVPRQFRDARIAHLKQASDFAKQCGIPGLQSHCGFLPENPNNPIYKEAVEAIREVASYCRKNGQSFRCETGQETPITLLRALKDVNVDNIGVNFDAANLILYGKADPVDAVDVLAPYIQGVHAKDGLYPTNPKDLGKEVPIGQGKVNFPAFIQRLKDAGYHGPLTIEREISGEKQAADIRQAKAYLEKLIG
ncbi:MAG TPA: sugar phosphate isomerase/epimerase family protein [Bryobacteraceae bacterium]|nr:sugar phosphate isomerase/epimerase family protein [Bryobacteraceae bacterium]